MLYYKVFNLHMNYFINKLQYRFKETESKILTGCCIRSVGEVSEACTDAAKSYLKITQRFIVSNCEGSVKTVLGQGNCNLKHCQRQQQEKHVILAYNLSQVLLNILISTKS